MSRRYAAKKDANQYEIERIFRTMLADHVTDTSGAGGGLGDLYVSYGQFGVFIEIKRDGKAPYTPAQIRFLKTHPYAVIRVETISTAKLVCAHIRQRGMKLA